MQNSRHGGVVSVGSKGTRCPQHSCPRRFPIGRQRQHRSVYRVGMVIPTVSGPLDNGPSGYRVGLKKPVDKAKRLEVVIISPQVYQRTVIGAVPVNGRSMNGAVSLVGGLKLLQDLIVGRIEMAHVIGIHQVKHSFFPATRQAAGSRKQQWPGRA